MVGVNEYCEQQIQCFGDRTALTPMKSLTSVHRIVFLAIALLYGVPLSAQHETMTFGIKAGAQLTRSFSFDGGSITADAGAETNYIRPIIGLVFEKRLSPTISIQVDALYNRE